MIEYTKLRSHIKSIQNQSYTESEIHKVAKRVKSYLDGGNLQENNSFSYFKDVIELIVATDNLHEAKNAGCFKLSTNTNPITFQLRDCLLKLSQELSLTAIDIQFLQNLPCINLLVKHEAAFKQKLFRDLNSLSSTFQKHDPEFSLELTLCAYLEYLIVKSRSENDDTIGYLEALPQERYDIIEVIDAISYIISQLESDEHKIRGLVCSDSIFSKRLDRLILSVCKLRALQNLVESNSVFSFNCSTNGKEIILASNSTNEELLKTYSLGYFYRFIAENNITPNILLPSDNQLYNEINECFSIESVDNPPRFRLLMPQFLLSKLCSVDSLSQDEDMNIRLETSELNLHIKIDQDIIYENITLLDYIQFHRMFKCFYNGQVKPLYQRYCANEITKQQFFQSIIPHLNKEAFISNFPEFKDKLESFFKLCCYRETGTRILDLLYQPVLSNKETIYPLCATSVQSNIGRNIVVLLKHLGKGIKEDGSEDPLISFLDQVFTNIGIIHTTNCKFQNTDIDFAFLIGNTIYIAECKNNFHPTDIYESRATVDAIYKAERQLMRITTGLASCKQNGLYQKLKIRNPQSMRIVPFIITGNRILAGTNCFRYPTRYFAEFVKYIEDGYINIGGMSIYTRSKGELIEADIDTYLSPSYLINQLSNTGIIKSQRYIQLGTNTIRYDYYSIDMNKLDKHCFDNWKVHIFPADELSVIEDK